MSVDHESIEVRAEAKLLEFLNIFDQKAAGGLTSKTTGRSYSAEEIGGMRERVKKSFHDLVKLDPDAMRNFADTFESAPRSPMTQMVLRGITADKGLADEYLTFLINSLRELAGESK